MRIRGAVVFEGAGSGVDSDRSEGVGAGEEDSATLGFDVCAADRDVAVAIVVGDVAPAGLRSYDTLVSTSQAFGYSKTDASGDAGPSDQRGWRERARNSLTPRANLRDGLKGGEGINKRCST